MIKVKIKQNFIEVSGHAEFSDYGTDIVCSSVSTAVIMTINLIEIFELNDCISVQMKDGFTKINIIKDDDILSKILNNLVYTLNDLEKEYSNNIKIEK